MNSFIFIVSILNIESDFFCVLETIIVFSTNFFFVIFIIFFAPVPLIHTITGCRVSLVDELVTTFFVIFY